jgi:hypothetical protein
LFELIIDGKLVTASQSLISINFSSNNMFPLVLSGFLPPQHPAEHPVQEVSEERKLHHHQDQQEPLPAVSL